MSETLESGAVLYLAGVRATRHPLGVQLEDTASGVILIIRRPDRSRKPAIGFELVARFSEFAREAAKAVEGRS